MQVSLRSQNDMTPHSPSDHFTLTDSSITWTGDGETVVVEAWGANSARVRSGMGQGILDTDYALLPPAKSACEVSSTGATASLNNGQLRVVLKSEIELDAQNNYTVHRCSIAFYRSDGTLLLKELDAGGSLKLKARSFKSLPGGAHTLTASFQSDPDENLVGMGQYQQDLIDLKGTVLELAHRNSQASVPFMMSSLGYGFLWHNPAIGKAVFAKNRTEWIADAAQQLDYWFTVGSSPSEIASSYGKATGTVPMMPEYGLGLWQSKLRYSSQEQLLEVAREYRARDLPLDVIVIDFFHWPKMGDYRFEEEFWPAPETMVQELDELGVKLMVSVWPQVSTESENFSFFRANNFLVQAHRGPDVQMSFEGPSMFLDATHPDARKALWDLCRKNYYDKGVQLFWLDEAEPEYGIYDHDNYRYHAGPSLTVGNVYPQMFSRVFFEGMQDAGQTEVVNLVRCAWAGSQRYGALVWSGDIHSTWADFRRQITAGIHMGVAGIPWFTTDIGGFHGGNTNDSSFRELLVRWFQFATFCPVMRMHGDRQPGETNSAMDGSRRYPSGGGNELWSFGDKVYGILAKYTRLREELRPYTRSLMKQAHENGQPIIRGLFHEFPDDPRAWKITDSYMFGPDFLIAPVVRPDSEERTVYLPAGAEWTDVHSGMVHEGGVTIEVPTPLDVIPIFSRNGAQQHLIKNFLEGYLDH